MLTAWGKVSVKSLQYTDKSCNSQLICIVRVASERGDGIAETRREQTRQPTPYACMRLRRIRVASKEDIGIGIGIGIGSRARFPYKWAAS